MVELAHIPGLHNIKYQPASTRTVDDVREHIIEARRLAVINGWDAVWFGMVKEGDKIGAIISANDKEQFDAAVNMLVPKPQPLPSPLSAAGLRIVWMANRL